VLACAADLDELLLRHATASDRPRLSRPFRTVCESQFENKTGSDASRRVTFPRRRPILRAAFRFPARYRPMIART
jgi:hypothetical protein